MQLCEPAMLLAQLISQSATFVTDWLDFTATSFIDLYRQTGPVCYWLLSPLRTAMSDKVSDKDAKRLRRKLLASVDRAVELGACGNEKC